MYFIDAIVNVHKINSLRFCYVMLERIFSVGHGDVHRVNAPGQSNFLLWREQEAPAEQAQRGRKSQCRWRLHLTSLVGTLQSCDRSLRIVW